MSIPGYDAWKTRAPGDGPDDYVEESLYDSEEDEDMDIDDLDEWVMDCGDPNCCMPGPHFRSECHTPEMVEDYMRECEESSDNQNEGRS